MSQPNTNPTITPDAEPKSPDAEKRPRADTTSDLDESRAKRDNASPPTEYMVRFVVVGDEYPGKVRMVDFDVLTPGIENMMRVEMQNLLKNSKARSKSGHDPEATVSPYELLTSDGFNSSLTADRNLYEADEYDCGLVGVALARVVTNILETRDPELECNVQFSDDESKWYLNLEQETQFEIYHLGQPMMGCKRTVSIFNVNETQW